MTEDFVKYLEMCVNFHHENDESFKITDSAYAKENLMYLKAIHYINELYNDVEENHTIVQNTGENQIEGGVVSIGGSVDTFRCWKCGRTLPISERTDSAYMSNPPKYACKECEGIKKEKQYRPFKDCYELIRYHEKHLAIVTTDLNHARPPIWVRSKRYKVDNLITAFDNDNESIGGSCVFLQDAWFDMNELFDCFTFLDGTPVGKLEEE